MNKIETRYNSKYNIDKYNRQTKSSLYIPKDQDIVFDTPLMFKVPRYYNDLNDFYIITIIKSSLISKYKTYIYEASVEYFEEKKEFLPSTGIISGSQVQYITMWSICYTEPEIITTIKNTKSISHNALKKYIDNIIDDVEYAKILLTMDKIND